MHNGLVVVQGYGTVGIAQSVVDVRGENIAQPGNLAEIRTEISVHGEIVCRAAVAQTRDDRGFRNRVKTLDSYLTGRTCLVLAEREMNRERRWQWAQCDVLPVVQQLRVQKERAVVGQQGPAPTYVDAA